MIEGLGPYPTARLVGLPWLATVPGHWRVARAKTLFRSVDVRSTAGAEELLTVSSERGVIPRRTANVTMFKAETYAGHKLCWPGDLVINSLWAWGRGLGVSPHHGIVSTAYGVYRARDEGSLLPEYVNALVRSSPFQWELQVRSKGIWISRLQLTDDSFFDAPLIVPPLNEQTLIVRFLDHADRRIRRLIAAKQRMIALLGEQKRAILHRAVLMGVNPEVTLKGSGASWLGHIPKHWSVKRLKELSPRISGRLVYQPAQYFSDDGVPFLMGNNVTPDGIRWTNLKRIPAEVNDKFAGQALHEGDVVMVRVGAPGVTCVVPAEADGLNCASMMIVRRNPAFDSHWLAMAMNTDIIKTQIAMVQYGAAQEQINIGDAVNFVLPVPPIEEQRAIVRATRAETRSLDAARSKAESQISLLREYRTRLIADVVTGKLDVRAAAAALPDETEPVEPLDDDSPEDTEDASPDEAEA